jgi:hypothetical protein
MSLVAVIELCHGRSPAGAAARLHGLGPRPPLTSGAVDLYGPQLTMHTTRGASTSSEGDLQ